MASPVEIFFRYLVTSAELSAVEAERLTRAKVPDDESSPVIWKKMSENIKNEAEVYVLPMKWFEMWNDCTTYFSYSMEKWIESKFFWVFVKDEVQCVYVKEK